MTSTIESISNPSANGGVGNANNNQVVSSESPTLSESSLSSINSNSSTGKLIKSLSKDKLSNTNKNQGKENGKVEQPKRKPIKFTVRKVSHEPIKSPILDSHPSYNPSHYHTKVQVPNTKNKTTISFTGNNVEKDKLKVTQQLEEQQSKYDQYESRINKINKEIDFLTNLLPPYNVEIDYATRTKINKAIEKLKMKQDEIEKKKYGLGISISRLWRELDGDDMWVRSVSNQ